MTDQLTNRDQAFQELRQIADYFSKTEPHSPISFLLEKAIRWGYMSLPELMQELVSGNDKVLSQINLVTGIDGEKTSIPLTKTEEKKVENGSTTENNSIINESVSEVEPKTGTEIVKTEVTTETKSKSSDSEFSW